MRLLSFLTTQSRRNVRAITHNISGSFTRDDGYTKEINTIMEDTFKNPPNIPSIIDGKRIYSDTKTLDTKTLDTKTLDTKTLDTKTPDTKTPDTKTPDTKTPVTKTPETKPQL